MAEVYSRKVLSKPMRTIISTVLAVAWLRQLGCIHVRARRERCPLRVGTSRSENEYNGPVGALLNQRTNEGFPASYVTMLSIVQGIVFGTLVSQSGKFVNPPGGMPLWLISLQGAVAFSALLLVSYRYLRLTILMRWAPLFLDTAIPFMLAAAQVAVVLSIGSYAAWLWSLCILEAFAAGAFAYTDYRSRGRAQVVDDSSVPVQVQWKLMSTASAITGVCAFLVVQLPAARPGIVTGIGIAVLVMVSILVLLSERRIRDLYKKHQLM